MTNVGFPSFGCDGVVPPSCACAAVTPVRGDAVLFLQPLEGGVEGGFLQLEAPGGEGGNGLVDLITVTVATEQPGQNDGIGMSPDQITGN